MHVAGTAATTGAGTACRLAGRHLRASILSSAVMDVRGHPLGCGTPNRGGWEASATPLAGCGGCVLALFVPNTRGIRLSLGRHPYPVGSRVRLDWALQQGLLEVINFTSIILRQRVCVGSICQGILL